MEVVGPEENALPDSRVSSEELSLSESVDPWFPPTGKVRVRLTIAFDGTAYQGWQTQKTGIGVQQKVQEALGRLFPSQPHVIGSSRTDTGVHALGLVAHFDVPREELRIPMRKLPLAVNAHLPEDIRVRQARRCRGPFHARFSAKAKEYRYQIWNHPVMNPLLRRYAWHVPRPLDLPAMRAGAHHFLGTHDFRAFSTNPGYERRHTVRTMQMVRLIQKGPLLTVVIRGDGFLYRMCRGMVGTLVQVGLGKFQPDQIPEMLASGDRRLAGMTAPAQGLILWRVFY